MWLHHRVEIRAFLQGFRPRHTRLNQQPEFSIEYLRPTNSLAKEGASIAFGVGELLLIAGRVREAFLNPSSGSIFNIEESVGFCSHCGGVLGSQA